MILCFLFCTIQQWGKYYKFYFIFYNPFLLLLGDVIVIDDRWLVKYSAPDPISKTKPRVRTRKKRIKIQKPYDSRLYIQDEKGTTSSTSTSKIINRIPN